MNAVGSGYADEETIDAQPGPIVRSVCINAPFEKHALAILVQKDGPVGPECPLLASTKKAVV